MTWEIVAGIITLFVFVGGVVTMALNIYKRIDDRIDKHQTTCPAVAGILEKLKGHDREFSDIKKTIDNGFSDLKHEMQYIKQRKET